VDWDSYSVDDDIDLDSASPATLRRAAARLRRATTHNAQAFLQMPRQAPTPSREEPRPSLSGLIPYRRIDAAPPPGPGDPEFDRSVRQARALATIELELERIEHERAAQAEAAKAEAAQAFQQTAIGQLYRR
jgi:hypothetical protein